LGILGGGFAVLQAPFFEGPVLPGSLGVNPFI
jgi:hypothetical protein